MKPRIPIALSSALAVLSLAPPPPGDGSALGAVPEYEFQRPVLNGMGAKRLADLRGRPLLVEYWGTATWGAPQYVGDLLTLKERWGDELDVLFIETQGADDRAVELAVLKNKWIASPVMWSTEYAIRTDMVAVPQFYLLSSEGEILMKAAAETWGLPLDERVMDELEAKIEAEAGALRDGPDEAPAEVRAAYRQFAKGAVGDAFATARALAAEPKGKDPAACARAAEAAAACFERRVATRLDRAAWYLDEGRLVELERELARLEGQLAAEAELDERWKALRAALDAPEQAAEREAAEALEKLIEKLASKGPKRQTVGLLERLAKKHAGTKSAARAARLVELASDEPD